MRKPHYTIEASIMTGFLKELDGEEDNEYAGSTTSRQGLVYLEQP